MMKIWMEHGVRGAAYDSIAEYAEHELNGDDYDTGQMEAMIATAENNSKAIGRLLDTLAEKGIINAQDVGTIIQEFAPDIINLGDPPND